MSELKDEITIALKEIGEIKPWWSEEDGMYIFEHPDYPFVVHADPDVEEVKKGYLRALKGFIEERMNNNVADYIDKATSGRGGYRPGSGRPKNKIPTIRIRVPEDVGKWLESNPSHFDQVRRLMG